MRKNNLLKKTLVIVILVLFIGTCLVSALDINSENEIVAKEISLLNLNDGLVGYWSFDFENAEDESINDNHGTVHGATPVDGISGRAFLFDGVDDYVDGGNVGTDVYTCNIWVKPDNTITKNSGAPGPGNSLDILVLSVPYYRYFCLGDCTTLVNDETISISDGYPPDQRTAVIDQDITNDTWHMITMVWNHGQNRYDIYFDGILQTVVSGGAGHVNLVYLDNFRISESVGKYEGKIDEVRIYNRTLGENEIQELYNNPAGLKTTIMFGRVSNLNADVGNLMTFEAFRLRCIQFSPFRFYTTTGEKIKISDDYRGLLTKNIAFGIFKSNI